MPTINVRGAEISYTDVGVGQAVVLLHGSACSSAQWRALARNLEGRCRVLAPDFYGSGETEAWPGRGPLSLSDEAALVHSLIESCGQPVHLVGHSYGGAVALRVAQEQPERLRSLTLIEPVAFHVLRDGGPWESELLEEVTELAAEVGAAAISGDYWGGMERFVDYWNGAGAWSRTRLQSRLAMSRSVGRVAANFHATLNEQSQIHEYRQLSVPTTILCGVESSWVTYAIAELLAANLPAARIRLIDEAGHSLPLSHPESVEAAILDHIDAQPTATIPTAAISTAAISTAGVPIAA